MIRILINAVVGNGDFDKSSNPGPGSLHFT